MKMFNSVKIMTIAAALVCVAAPAFADHRELAEAFKSSYIAESRGKLQEAYDILNSSEVDMRNYPAVMRLAYLKSRMLQPAEAARLYALAAQIEPTAVEPLLYQQYQYLVLKDSVALVAAAREGLKRDPNNYYSRTRLAYALYQMKKYSDAADEYSKVAALYPLDLDVMLYQGWSLALAGSRSEAMRTFQRLLMVSPYNASAKEGVAFLSR